MSAKPKTESGARARTCMGSMSAGEIWPPLVGTYWTDDGRRARCCVDCGTEVIGGARGRVPMRCADCAAEA